MPIRDSHRSEVARRARRQMMEVIGDLRLARHNAGLSQAAVAGAIGVSRQQLSSWERGRREPALESMARWGAIVGLDVSLRTFVGGSPMRDAGQLRVMERFRKSIGPMWSWRTEVPVRADQHDRRAFDAVLSHAGRCVAVEVVSRLLDSQGQIRPILLKQAAGDVDGVVLVLPDSRHNRIAIAAASSSLDPAFPCTARAALAALRRGVVPPANAVVLV